jgi:hypothetical protein
VIFPPVAVTWKKLPPGGVVREAEKVKTVETVPLATGIRVVMLGETEMLLPEYVVVVIVTGALKLSKLVNDIVELADSP